MKFTLSWLRDHLDTSAPLEELSEKLSSIGLEVESIDDPAKNYFFVFDCRRYLEI